MFTGIVLGLAEIKEVERREALTSYAVDLPWRDQLQLGASVSIDGVCQTVVKMDQWVWFDAIEETLEKTTLADLQIGQRVNVERALRLGDELGGHMMSGHVIGCGTLLDRDEGESTLALRIGVDSDLMRYILNKGFVAVDGVSLTVGEVGRDSFFVHLIPETRDRTTLGTKRAGDRVNIELDAQTQAIVATTERVLQHL